MHIIYAYFKLNMNRHAFNNRFASAENLWFFDRTNE
jgi:hypothetical protein